MSSRRAFVLAVALFVAVPAPAHAKPLFPLESLSPATTPPGETRLRFGVKYNEGERLLFQDRDKDRRVFHLPEVDLAVGASENTEILLRFPFLYLNQEGQGWEFGSGDLRIESVYRLVGEGPFSPQAALHLGVKLPNADEVKEFGTNETDVFLGALFSGRRGDFTFLLNADFAILGNPRSADPNQDDVLLYKAGTVYSFSRDWIAALELDGVEFSRYGNDRLFARAGVSAVWKGWVLDAGVAVGMTEASGDFQARVGVTLPFGVARKEPGLPCP